MRRRFLVSSVLVGSLVCGSLAFAQPRPVAPPPKGDLPPEPQVDDPMLKPVPRPKTEIATWEDALNHVRARSTDLRISAQEIARAEAASRTAIAGALFSINGSGAYTHNIITNPVFQPTGVDATGAPTFREINTPFPNYLNGTITGSQPVLALRAWYAIGTAGKNEEVAALTLGDTKRQIAINVANAIVAVVTAERVAELNRVGLRNALARLDLATRKTNLGSGTGIDIIRARQDVETARGTLIAGDESLRQAREALGLALGLPTQVGVPPNVDLNGLEASARTTCKAAPNLDERPDIAALHGRVEVAHRQHNDAKLQFAPTVDLRSAVASTTLDTGASPNTTWNIQGVLTVPIWDGGVRYGTLRDTAAQEEIARQKLESARRTAEIQVTQARRAVGVAEERRRVAGQQRDLAADNDRLTRTAYLEGRGTSLELVTAAQALRAAEIELAVRDFDLVKARIGAVLALASCPW